MTLRHKRRWCIQPILVNLNPRGLTKHALSRRSVHILCGMWIIAILWPRPLWKKYRALLHMHTKKCMCGALYDLRMAKPRAKPSKHVAKPVAQVAPKPTVNPATREPIPMALLEHMSLFKVKYPRYKKWHTEVAAP